jgi:hypothetical protein
MRFLFPGVANKEANEAFFLLSSSILKAFWICATSYKTNGSFSSNPIAWKRASIRKALLSCGWMLFGAIPVESKERKSLLNLLK